MDRLKPLLGAVFVACCCALAGAVAGQEVSAPLALDDPAARTDSPSVALAPDGRVGVAWVSDLDHGPRILFREKTGGQWSAPVEFGQPAPAEPSEPLLLYDSWGNPQLLWRDGPAAQRVVAYARRQAGRWIEFGPISEGLDREVDQISAGFDSRGRLHAAWREGSGTARRIIAATFDENGELHRADLTAGLEPGLNLYPTVLPMSPLVVAWFREEDDPYSASLVLEARQYDGAKGEWGQAELPDLSAMPINRLPILFTSNSGQVIAVWHDLLDGADRIFYGLGGESRGAGRLIDDNSTGANKQPFGVCDGQGTPVLCWRGQTGDGPAIFVRRAPIDSAVRPSIRLSVPQPPFAWQPSIAADDDDAYVVWTSNADDGGTGNIYYSEIRWNEQ